MAGASLLTLLDDIAAVLDDVAAMTKVAAKKTAGVLGDDLALNAQQVSGVRADRELPVVWAVAKGSFKNKLFLVPAALLISAFIPWAVTPLLMIGGLYLCFEGFEKLAHKFLHSKEEDTHKHQERLQAVADPEVDIVAFEQEKVKGAIRTDFILSAEIIAITLGTVALASFTNQVIVLSGIAIAMTVGVYGLVAGIVKLDDAGLYLSQRQGDGLTTGLLRSFGRGLLLTAPYLMKTLSVVGTAAMFMVGGGILTHGIPVAQQWIDSITQSVAQSSSIAALLTPTLLNLVAGIIAGAIALLLFSIASRIWRAIKPAKAAN
jgi:predicted DNA repair protein MutK